ncbi:MAG: glycosyltransferase family 4 protein [Deltaproteobacteria bacterium]|nr:glycosyltransferase family 4 protein [Deltaproteobacteria bacterium]
MKIAFIFNEGRIRRLEKIRNGSAANEFYYGAIQLQQRGYVVEYYEVNDLPRPSIGQKIVDILFKSHLLPTRVNGSLLMQTISICRKLEKVDIIVATSTGLAFAFGLLKSLKLIEPQIVALCLTLIYHKHSWLRSRINGFVLRRIWTQLFGDSEREGIAKMFNVPENHILVNQYGVDINYWTPAGKEEDYVLSVGNDSRRDYDLLLDVARKVNLPFLIVTVNKISGPIPENVKIISGTKPSDDPIDDQLRELYRKAMCVVLPIKETIRPSGQSVCLQAMSCGKTVILSKTQGLWSTKMLQHNKNIILIPPGDEEALAQAIIAIDKDSEKRKNIGIQARENICSEGNISIFADRLENLIKKVLQENNINI